MYLNHLNLSVFACGCVYKKMKMCFDIDGLIEFYCISVPIKLLISSNSVLGTKCLSSVLRIDDI